MESLNQFELEVYCSGLIKFADNKDERIQAYTKAYNIFFSRIKSHPQFNLNNTAYIEYSNNLSNRILDAIQISNRPDTLIMEFGCGRGFLIAEFAKRFPLATLIGIDIAINETIHNYPNLKFEKQNLLYGFESRRKADLVLSDQVIEHIHPLDIDDFMVNLISSIKPGGHLFIGTPNSIWGPHDISGILDFEKTIGFHLFEYSSKELINLCEKHKLKFTHSIVMLRGYGLILSKKQYTLIEGAISLLPKKIRSYLRKKRLLGWANIRFIFVNQ